MPGKLFVVATPVGNLGDISPRTRQALRDSDVILAEDTRVTIKLLNHLDLKKRLVSCHKFNEKQRKDLLIDILNNDQIASLVSDAGTPLISDPGQHIVGEAISLGIKVTPIPGPSAFLLALTASGLSCARFSFEGFLPDKTQLAKKQLQELSDDERTLVFHVAPTKLLKTLQLAKEVLGDRKACVARELTKLHEEFIREKLSVLIGKFADEQIRGEIVLIVEGGPEHKQILPPSMTTIAELIAQDLKDGKSVNEIAQLRARQFGLRKSDIYTLAVRKQEEHKN